MSQLTDEQVKVLHDVFIGYFAPHQLEKAIGDVQEKLKPLPSYGEVFQNARRGENNNAPAWVAVDEQVKIGIEAGAQAVRRAVYEREIAPDVKSAIEDIRAGYGSRATNTLGTLIKEFE